jgi:hypothetical protein
MKPDARSLLAALEAYEHLMFGAIPRPTWIACMSCLQIGSNIWQLA